jgi:peptidyl-prolyl cis-trans isomerase SurA
MNPLSIFCLLLGTSSLMLAQALPKDPERVLLERWSELNADRIQGNANGQPITLSDIRRQLGPVSEEIRRGSKDDTDFDQKIKAFGLNTHEEIINRQLAIAEFKAKIGKLPASYIDSDIEDTIRRDFGGDRNRFVAYLRSQGLTPMSYRKLIEDRIIFDSMVSQIRRTALAVGPGKVKAYYDTHQTDFARKESVQLRQITLMQGASETVAEGKARAEAWAAALRDPAKLPATMARFKVSLTKKTSELGFAEIAEIISIDDYAKQGGDTGWKPLEESNERVVGVLRQLKDGEVSEALQFDIPGSPALWFILKREGLKAAGTDTLDDPKVRSLVEERVRSQAMNEAVGKWFTELRAKHHIEYR